MNNLKFTLLSLVRENNYIHSTDLLNACEYNPNDAMPIFKGLLKEGFLEKTFAADPDNNCTVSISGKGQDALLSELEARHKEQQRAESEAKQKEDERISQKREARRSRIHDLILVLVSALVAFLLDLFKMK